MVRQIILAVALLLAAGSNASAELNLGEILGKVPALKQGIAYSLADNKINYLSTVEVVKWKGLSLEAGYAGAAEETNHKAVGVVSYQVARLKDFGVELPVLDLVELNVGYYVGVGRIQFTGDTDNDNELDHGISATLISLKF